MQVPALRRVRFLGLFCLPLFLILGAACLTVAQVTVAQISDTHIGENHSPHALDNLRRAVDMINRRHPDAVILSGDIGENSEYWEQARRILRGLHEPLYIAPGNHDVHTMDVDRYRQVFGNDYYRFNVKGVTFVVIDSQLLGNFDHFDSKSPPGMPDFTRQQSDRMMDWLEDLAANRDTGDRNRDDRDRDGRWDRQRDSEARDDRDQRRDNGDPGPRIVIGIQHIPVFRDERVLPDPKPYWVISDPYRSREMDLLKRLGVRHMLVGHWHVYDVFDRGGITWHVGPATSWLPWGGELGFAIHTIDPNGEVHSEFVSLHSKP
jgi:3',5'-cyclic AMP phosphodiesterase CpdA